MEKLKELVTCPICLDILTDPVTIPDCGHSFCRSCLISTQEAGWNGCEICLNSNNHLREAFICHFHFRCPVCRKILSYTKKEIQAMPTDKILATAARAQQRIESARPNDVKKVIQRQAEKLSSVLASRLNVYDLNTDKKLQRLVSTLNYFVRKCGMLSKNDAEKKFYHLAHEVVKISSDIHTIEKAKQQNRLKQAGRRHEARPTNPQLSRSDSYAFSDAMHVNPLSILARLLEHDAGFSPWAFQRFSLDHFFGSSLFRPFPFRAPDNDFRIFDDFDLVEAEMNRAFANIPFWSRL